ncbi:MAG: hypothetical protein HZB37_07265 [Planctomycetes bacterium]|nr:hypothetical protein [Planctomycetota bacterium]
MLTPEALRTAGYPLESLFIWCDDAEYCLRLKSAGYRFFAVPSSIIYHQRQETAVKNIGVWKVIYYPTVQHQKYYYHVRNSIYIAGRYYGRIPWLKQVAGLLLQFVLTAIKHKEPKEIIKYFILGFWDAMRGRYGMKASKSDSRTPGLP